MNKANSDDNTMTNESLIDMSSGGIASRLREVSELYELGRSLSRAKPLQESSVRLLSDEINDTSTLPSPTDDVRIRD
jgi:hypothetical protein